MAYSRGDVRTALAKAKDAGADCLHMRADDRDTVISLEKWGFLPLDPARADKKVADWYVAQGLAVRDNAAAVERLGPSTGRNGHAEDSLDVGSHVAHNDQIAPKGATTAAMSAVEAALGAAQAALVLARLMAPAEENPERDYEGGGGGGELGVA